MQLESNSVTSVKTKKPRSLTRKILYGVAIFLVFGAVVGGVLLNSFPNTIIHYIVEPKLKRLITDRLGKRYSLEMNSIKLSGNKDSLILTGVRIVDNGKTAEGSTDTANNFGVATPLDRLTTDTVMISGLEYWKLVMEKGLYAGTISIRSPKIYLRPGSLPKFEKSNNKLPKFLPAVSSKIIKVENAEVYFTEETPAPGMIGHAPGTLNGSGDKAGRPPVVNGVLVKKASLEFHDFYLDESALENSSSTFFCKSATFHAEDISHIDSTGLADLHVGNVDGDLIDSTMNVTSIDCAKPIDEIQRISIDHVDFAGLDWFSALSRHGLHSGTITVGSPKLYLKDIAEISQRPSLQIAASDFIPLPSLLPDISVGDVEIKNAEVYALLPKSKNVSSLKKVDMSLGGLAIDSTTSFTNISKFFSKSANIRTHEESNIYTALGTIHVGAINGNEKTIAVSNVRLDPTIKGLKSVKVKSVEVSGLDIWKVIMRKGVFVSSVKVVNPAIYLDASLTPPIVCIDSLLCRDPLLPIREFTEYPLPPLVPVVNIGRITLSGASVHGIHSLDDPKKPSRVGDSIGGLRASLTNFNLDQKSWIRNRGMLFSRGGTFSVGAITQHTPGAIYSFSEGGVEGDLSKHTLTINSIHLNPLISVDSFSKVFKFRTERLDFIAPKTEISGIDYQKLFLGQGIFADSIYSSNWKLNIYGDRRLPEEPRTSRDKYPQELFQEIKMSIGINHVAANDGEIAFTESWPDTTVPGTITFDSVNALIGKVSNNRSMSDTTPTQIEASLKIMNAGLVKCDVSYQLMNPHLAMNVSGSLGSMDAATFNSYLLSTEPFTLTGHVRSAQFHFNLQDSLLTGTIVPQYDSIRVTFFRWDRFPPGFVSFFANALIMRTHNIPEKDNPLHTAEISAVLDPDVNQFWALWEPIRSAVGSVVRIPGWVW